MGRQPQRAPDGAPVHYERHRPEQTTLTFAKDQVLMQRVLSTKSDRDAGRSVWAFGLIMIPGGFMFYTIGTALYTYYKSHPERMNPLLSIDATFPLFIAAELPMGVTGLIIAGIFAAAMSTLSSIINSVATLASVDFYEKLVQNPTPKQSVLFAEVMTVVAGLVGRGLCRRLHAGHVHPPRQLTRGGHRHRIEHRADNRGLVHEPGASLFLSCDLNPAVHRHRLRGEPVFSGAGAVVEGADDLGG